MTWGVQGPHMGHTTTAEMRETTMPEDEFHTYEPTGELNCSCGEQLRPAETKETL